MVKTFIVHTTTGEKWEMCGGTYLVIAKDTEQAKKDVEKYLSDNNLNEK